MPFVSLTARPCRGEARVVTVTSRKSSSPGRRYPEDAVAGRSADAPRDPRHRFGAFGEDRAAEYLRRRGFEILARNVRTAYGEIDIVARDGATVVFIEVKSRRSRGGLEAVDARKRKRLSRLALAFLARAGWLDRPARFDVIAVASDGACTHVANAFDCAPT
jgi:putative endonuclease